MSEVKRPSVKKLAAKRPGEARTSKYVGVTWHRSDKKWQVAIKVNGKSQHLGQFHDEHEAAAKYDEKAGPLGRKLNFPKEGGAPQATKAAGRISSASAMRSVVAASSGGGGASSSTVPPPFVSEPLPAPPLPAPLPDFPALTMAASAASFNDHDLYGSEGYDQEGYDREGYDRNGYDRGGFDKRGNPDFGAGF